MDMDLGAAGRAFAFLGTVADNLVTLHAGFVLGFITAVAGLRRSRRGKWGDRAYVGFVVGVNGVLLVAIVFLGLRLSVPEWMLFVLGLAAATLAWLLSGGLPSAARRSFARVAATAVVTISSGADRLRRPRVPDRLPPELRALGLREH